MIIKVAFVAKHIFCDIFFLYIPQGRGGGYSFFSVAASRKIALKKLLTLKEIPKKHRTGKLFHICPLGINCLARGSGVKNFLGDLFYLRTSNQYSP